MSRGIKWLLFAFLLSAFFATHARANTINAASCAESDVAAAVAKAANGDTVVIPSCPSGVSWTTSLTITKGITLIGQGPGNTVINDNTSKGDSNCSGAVPLIDVNENTNVFVRVSGFTINGVKAAFNCGESAKHIGISGSTHQFRVDHLTINQGVAGITVTGDAWGVIDHNTLNNPFDVFAITVHHANWQGVGDYGDNSYATPDTMGMPGTIANPTSQAAAVYIETNTFIWPGSGFPVGCTDSEHGGRLVFRFNTGCSFGGGHGLDSSGRIRSFRQWEYYNNPFVTQAQLTQFDNEYTALFLRGGTGMVFNNTFNNNPNGVIHYNSSVISPQLYRATDEYAPWGRAAAITTITRTSNAVTANLGTCYPSVPVPPACYSPGTAERIDVGGVADNSFDTPPQAPFIVSSGNGTTIMGWSQTAANASSSGGFIYSHGGCDGTGPFDTNDGVLYASGTASASSTKDNMVANGSPGWTVNQWQGFSIHNSTAPSAWGSTIISNTANTLVTQALRQSNGPHNWASGDRFQILKAYPCLDQPGRGMGLLLQDLGSVQAAVLASTGKPGPANQALDPIYQWLNTVNGVNALINVGDPLRLLPNRDYYDYTPSFNGSSGVGSGTLAGRPATCTKGVGYWATDQGNWNQSGSGGQGQLYVCTATDTWSLYYEPFTYPHPLTQGGTPPPPPPPPPPPAPPTNLGATVH